MGVMLSAAGSLRWFRDALAPGTPFDQLVEEAAPIEPGAEGLLFLPYLSGERTPYPDPDARGAFVGLSLLHRRPHMTRAVLEGVAFGLRDSLELMKSLGLDVRTVRAQGGGARSPLWRQILADVLGAEVAVPEAEEGAALGAALLAGVGAGVWSSVAETAPLAGRVRESIQPGPDAPRYDEIYPRYRALYPALAPEFAAMAHLQEELGTGSRQGAVKD
jgi:xylulokinase